MFFFIENEAIRRICELRQDSEAHRLLQTKKGLRHNEQSLSTVNVKEPKPILSIK